MRLTLTLLLIFTVQSVFRFQTIEHLTSFRGTSCFIAGKRANWHASKEEGRGRKHRCSVDIASEPAIPKTVFITGCTGRIGREVVARLGATNFNVRCGVRDVAGKGDYLKKLGASEIVPFDYTDESSWPAALSGVSGVYSASLDPLLEHHLKFAEFLGTLKPQIEHVVRISCMGADTNTASYDKDKHVTRAGAGIPLMLQHYWWGEEALVKAGLPLTVLRNNFFMNHLLKTDCENIGAMGSTEPGFFSNPLGAARNSFVSTADIGEAAARIIEEGPQKHANKFYDLTGPEPQSMYEIAADLGVALNKEVEYRPQSMEQFEKDFGAVRAGFFEYLCNGFYTRCSPDFYNIVGRKPTSYAEYLTTKTPSGVTGLEELYEGNLWKKGVDAMKDAAKAKQ